MLLYFKVCDPVGLNLIPCALLVELKAFQWQANWGAGNRAFWGLSMASLRRADPASP